MDVENNNVVETLERLFQRYKVQRYSPLMKDDADLLLVSRVEEEEQESRAWRFVDSEFEFEFRIQFAILSKYGVPRFSSPLAQATW